MKFPPESINNEAYLTGTVSPECVGERGGTLCVPYSTETCYS